MKKKLTFSLILFLTAIASFAQTDLQFSKICNEIEDNVSTKTDSIYNLIQKLKTIPKYKSGKYKSQLLNYEALIFCQYKADFEKAKKNNDVSFELNKKLKNEYGLAYNYFNYAQIFHRKSDFTNSVKYYHKALNFSKKTKNHNLLHKIYIGLSGIYLDQRDYQKALEYAQNSEKLYKISNNKYQYGIAIGFIAENYRMQGNSSKAELFFKKAYQIHKKNNKIEGMAWVLGNWSLIYETDIIKSVEMVLEAEKLWNQIAPEGYLAVNNLGNIGWCFDAIANNDSLRKIPIANLKINSKQEYLDKSESYYKKAIAISKKTKTPNIYLYFSKSLAELQAKRNKYKKAYENINLYTKLNDSLYSQENKNKISEIENAKKIAVKDKQIEINQLIINKNKSQRLFFIIMSFLFFCIGILFYNLYRYKNASNIKLEKLNEELKRSNYIKNRFFNILNHDLRGPVAQIVQYFNFKKEKIINLEESKDLEKKIILKSENLLVAMEDLLLWGKSQMKSVEIKNKEIQIEEMFLYLYKYFSYADNYSINYINDNLITINTDEDILKTICRNLTSNSINALKEKPNKSIVWTATIENGEKILRITDNCGSKSINQFENIFIDENNIGIKHGLGLHLIRELAKSIHCEITVETNETQTEISLIFTENIK